MTDIKNVHVPVTTLVAMVVSDHALYPDAYIFIMMVPNPVTEFTRLGLDEKIVSPSV